MNIALHDRQMTISFRYDPDLVAIVQALPDGRRFHKQTRTWIAPVTADNLRHLIRNRCGNATLEHKLAEIEKPLTTTAPAEAPREFKTKPYQHQLLGFNMGTANDKVALWWEQGTGKTWAAANILQYRIRAGQVKRALVLAPKTVLTSWKKELAKHTELEPTTIEGKNRESRLQHGQVCLMNYELLLPLADVAEAQPWDMVILDESYYIKSISAQRTKIAWAVCTRAKYRMLLCGSPIANGPEDLFAQYRALDDGETFGPSFYSFRAKYFENKGQFYPDWQVKPGALAEIHTRMFSKGHRITKAECFDLPAKNYQTVEVEMEKEQARIYRDMEDLLVAEIDGAEVTAQNVAVKMMKLNQITSGFFHDEEGTHAIRHHKLDALADLLRDKPKAVVWALFRYDIERITEAFPEMNPVVIAGDVELKDREQAIERFQTDPSCRLFIGQIRAGGIGITLTAAQFVVYYSQGYSLIDRAQSEDRTHRIGTTGTVTYVDLVCPGTVDEEILQVLEEKRALADYMTGDIANTILQRLRQKGGRGTLRFTPKVKNQPQPQGATL